MKMQKKLIWEFTFMVAILLFFLTFTQSALAGSATLTWVKNTEPDLSSYKVYYGTSTRTGTDPKTCGLCGYTNTQSVAKGTTETMNYSFSNLTNSQTYYFS